jgi:hypothetical protein
MKRVLAAVVLVLAMLAVVQPVSLAAQDSYQTRIKGEGAEAYSSQFDGCVNTFSYLYAQETSFRVRASYIGPGAPQEYVDAYGYFYYVQYDYCLGQYSAFFNAYLSRPDVNIQGNLNRGSVNATAEVYDYLTNSWDTVRIDIAFEGVGKVSRGNGHQNFSNEYFSSHSHYNGNSRNATATGTIGSTSGVVELTYDSAYLRAIKSGTLDLYRYQ